MAMATSCVYNGQVIDVSEALRLRDVARKTRAAGPSFTCEECGKPVRAHKASKDGGAHMEHHDRNPGCSRSHLLPSAARA